MALDLPRLPWVAEIVTKTGTPTQAMQVWWDRVAKLIETTVADILDLISRVATTESDIAELQARNLTAGAGLTGGGDLTADRTFNVGAGAGIAVNANDVALDTGSSRNVDHAAVSIVAGAGLTGGGDTTASRTLNVGAGTGITVNADDIALTVPTASGTYTPTLTNVTNIDSSSVASFQYMRVGDVVTVSGLVQFDPTAAALCELDMTLPIASNFANQRECAGTAGAPGYAANTATIYANTTGDLARLSVVATMTVNATWMLHFTYRII